MAEDNEWNQGDPLEVREEEGEQRYYLQGHLLTGGEWIEVLLDNHSWLRLIFSEPRNPEQKPSACLLVYNRNFPLPRGILFALPEEAILRWTGETTRVS